MLEEGWQFLLRFQRGHSMGGLGDVSLKAS